MAIKLSRVKGCSFAGVTIDNTDNIYLLDVDRPTTPELRYNELIVPNRHGDSRDDDSYASNDISIVIGVYATTAEECRAKIRSLIAPMLQKESKLIFADEPSLFYYAKFYNSIPTKETDVMTELTIVFHASPFKYELYTDARDLITNETYGIITEDADGILTNTAIWQDITASQFKQLVNAGNQATMPIITITGTAARIAMTFDDVAFSFNGLSNETVFIDSEKMIVYTINGVKKVSRLTSFNGLFPSIKVGTSDVMISGSSFDVDIEAKYRNTYIV